MHMRAADGTFHGAVSLSLSLHPPRRCPLQPQFCATQIMHHLAGHPNVVQLRGTYEDKSDVHLVMEVCSGGELFDRYVQDATRSVWHRFIGLLRGLACVQQGGRLLAGHVAQHAASMQLHLIAALTRTQLTQQTCVLLRSIVERGHYTEKDAARMVRTIVAVVGHCHNMGVIHRDLKPENFLLTDTSKDAAVKATDFGLSVFFKEGQVRRAHGRHCRQKAGRKRAAPFVRCAA